MYLTQLRVCIKSSNSSNEMESQVSKVDKLTFIIFKLFFAIKDKPLFL